MRLTTIDEAHRRVAFDADPARVAALNHFFASNPGILGLGVGGRYNKHSAKDATEAQAFAVSQLAFVEAKMYEVQYAPMMYEELLASTISYAAGPWAKTVEYQIVDYVGMGRRISHRANDIPFVDVAYKRQSIPVVNGGVGYEFTTEDVRTSSYLGRPLPTEKLKAAMTAFRRHMNVVALTGEAESNFTGLFNNGSVTAANRPSGAVWDAATGDTIISDFIAGVSAIQTATKNNSKPTKVALPIATFQLLLKRAGSTSDITILEYLQKIYPGITIYSVYELATLGAGSTKRVVFFDPQDENMVFHIPMPIAFQAPQFQQLRIEVVGEYKYGGFEVRRVPTAYYMDGV